MCIYVHGLGCFGKVWIRRPVCLLRLSVVIGIGIVCPGLHVLDLVVMMIAESRFT